MNYIIDPIPSMRNLYEIYTRSAAIKVIRLCKEVIYISDDNNDDAEKTYDK